MVQLSESGSRLLILVFTLRGRVVSHLVSPRRQRAARKRKAHQTPKHRFLTAFTQGSDEKLHAVLIS